MGTVFCLTFYKINLVFILPLFHFKYVFVFEILIRYIIVEQWMTILSVTCVNCVLQRFLGFQRRSSVQKSSFLIFLVVYTALNEKFM